jgi:hypothetical protein
MGGYTPSRKPFVIKYGGMAYGGWGYWKRVVRTGHMADRLNRGHRSPPIFDHYADSRPSFPVEYAEIQRFQ